MHLAQIGPPQPFLCVPTGRTWPARDPRGPADPVRRPDEAAGEIMVTIPALCRCGIITEYRVITPEEAEEYFAREREFEERRTRQPRRRLRPGATPGKERE